MSTSAWLTSGFAAVFLGLALATAVVLGALAERRQVSRSLTAIGHSGTAPTALPFKQRILLPALDQCTNLGRALSPGETARKLVRRLDLAGNPAPWDVDRLLAVKAVGLVLTLALGFLVFADKGLVRALLLTVPAGAFVFWLPDILLYNTGQKRQVEIQRTLPDALDLLTISVEAGMGFDAALNQVARNTDGPLAGEFYRVLQEMQMQSRSDALRALGDRTTVVDLRSFVSSLVQADKLGVPVGRVLREQSKEMRLKRRQRAEEQAMKVPVKILFPMVVCILPVLFVVVLGPAFMEFQKTLQGGL